MSTNKSCPHNCTYILLNDDFNPLRNIMRRTYKDKLNTNRQSTQVETWYFVSGWGWIVFFASQKLSCLINNCIHHEKKSVAIICEIFCNLNIPLANACVMNCFAINLLNKTAIIILHVAVKQAREISPIWKLGVNLIYDSWVSTLILFSRMSYQFLKKVIKVIRCHIKGKAISNKGLPGWETNPGKI